MSRANAEPSGGSSNKVGSARASSRGGGTATVRAGSKGPSGASASAAGKRPESKGSQFSKPMLATTTSQMKLTARASVTTDKADKGFLDEERPSLTTEQSSKLG